jgi:outer membrane protein TolC
MILLFYSYSIVTISQNESPSSINNITLEEVLQIANRKSLDAFKAKRKYEYSYWKFKSFKASLLPKITFNTNPITFRRSLIERYDSELDRDVFRSIQNLNSSARISLSQNIPQTGGVISLNSNYNRLINFNPERISSYNTAPVNLSLSQPIMAFNRFKWQKKTAPLEYEKSKKELIYQLQSINVKTVNYFFNWALISKRVDMAEENLVVAERLYKIGKRRYKIGSIEKEDVLNLELQFYNSETRLISLKNQLTQRKNDLKLFLREDIEKFRKPLLPELIPLLKIDVDRAIKLFEKNNPDILNLTIEKIESDKNLDRIIKDNRFDLSLSANYGLNQQSDNFLNSFNNLLDQQGVSIRFQMPILDWGERKGNIKKAKMNKEVEEIDLQQKKNKLYQGLKSKIFDFNLQEKLVSAAFRATEISKESYLITEKRFLSGRVTLLKLTSALRAWQSNNENYISRLSSYWKYYYELQQYTLYNFIENRELDINFEKGILE